MTKNTALNDVHFRIEREKRSRIFSQTAHFPLDKIPFRWKTVLKANRVLQADKRRYSVSAEACPIWVVFEPIRTSPNWENFRGSAKEKTYLDFLPFPAVSFSQRWKKRSTREEIFHSGEIDFFPSFRDSFQSPLCDGYPRFLWIWFLFRNNPRGRVFNRCPFRRLPLLLARRGEQLRTEKREDKVLTVL